MVTVNEQSENNAPIMETNEVEDKSQDTEQTNENVSEKAEGTNQTTSDDTVTPDEEQESIPIPDVIADLLEPINTDNLTGVDIDNTEDQEVYVEVYELTSEMVKPGGINYEKTAAASFDLLANRTKHLRIAAWLAFSWFHTIGVRGFRDGLALIYHLLETFPEQIYPINEPKRASSIQVLNADKWIKPIEKIEPNERNADLFLEIYRIFSALEEKCNSLFTENTPRLNNIGALLQEKEKEANEILKSKAARAEAKEKQDQKRKEKEKQTEPKSSRLERDKSSTQTKTRSESKVEPTGLKLASDGDADRMLESALKYYFEGENDKEHPKTIPEDPSIFGLSRIYRWSNLNMPANKDGITQIEGPNATKQEIIQDKINNKEWDWIVADLEIKLIESKRNSRVLYIVYWLDTQRYVAQALEAKGGKYSEAAAEVKFQLARLLKRLPGLLSLKFKDKGTPFANEDTLLWYQDEVLPVVGNNQPRGKILPPIMGEDYEPINGMYQKICDELPDNFEKNLKMLQDSIYGDTRPKGRFLRLLACANFCYSAKQYLIARMLLRELSREISRYNIMEWEQALCVSVWQTTYLNNLKLSTTDIENEGMKDLHKEQRQLFEQISTYDSILAINLMNKEKEKGE